MPLKELSNEEQSQMFIQGRATKTKPVQLTRKDLGIKKLQLLTSQPSLGFRFFEKLK